MLNERSNNNNRLLNNHNNNNNNYNDNLQYSNTIHSDNIHNQPEFINGQLVTDNKYTGIVPCWWCPYSSSGAARNCRHSYNTVYSPAVVYNNSNQNNNSNSSNDSNLLISFDHALQQQQLQQQQQKCAFDWSHYYENNNNNSFINCPTTILPENLYPHATQPKPPSNVYLSAWYFHRKGKYIRDIQHRRWTSSYQSIPQQLLNAQQQHFINRLPVWIQQQQIVSQSQGQEIINPIKNLGSWKRSHSFLVPINEYEEDIALQEEEMEKKNQSKEKEINIGENENEHGTQISNNKKYYFHKRVPYHQHQQYSITTSLVSPTSSTPSDNMNKNNNNNNNPTTPSKKIITQIKTKHNNNYYYKIAEIRKSKSDSFLTLSNRYKRLTNQDYDDEKKEKEEEDEDKDSKESEILADNYSHCSITSDSNQSSEIEYEELGRQNIVNRNSSRNENSNHKTRLSSSTSQNPSVGLRNHRHHHSRRWQPSITISTSATPLTNTGIENGKSEKVKFSVRFRKKMIKNSVSLRSLISNTIQESFKMIRSFK